MTTARIVVLAIAFTFASLPAFAEESSSVGTPRQRAKDTSRDLIDGSGQSSWGGEDLGSRGPTRPAKKWGDMTEQEKDAASRAWMLNSGDFGKPGRANKAPSRPVPTIKDRKPAADSAEKAGAQKANVP